MERECLHILLRGSQPIIICPARTLEGIRITKEFRTPLDQNRLLFLSSLPKTARRPTIENARYRNHFVCALADSVLVPYAVPGSKTFELCRELLVRGKSLVTFSGQANQELLEIGAKPLGNNWDFVPIG